MTSCVLDHGENEHGPIRQPVDIGLLCAWHRRRLTTTTRNIADLWLDLALLIEAGSAPKDETPKTRHLKSAEAPAPANLEALALYDRRSSPTRLPERWVKGRYFEADNSTPIPPVTAIVAGWVLCLAEERPLTATVLPGSVLAQLELLTLHHDWIAAQLWIDDYVTELTDVHKALKAAVRDHEAKLIGYCRLPVADRTCGGQLLKENGSGVIRCTSCRESWVTPQQQAMLAVALETP